jgi:hypothetical protein
MPDLSYSIWSIWTELPFLHKLFSLILLAVGVYSLVSAAKILWRVRSLLGSVHSKHSIATQGEMAMLSARHAYTRNLVTATFYLFGIVFFWGLRFTLWTADSKTPVGVLILKNLVLYFAFATNALLVFFVIHLVQWFVSARLHAFRSMACLCKQP